MPPRIFVDTNLLMLLAVGTYRKDFIREHKRTDKFSEEDFDNLIILIEGHDLIVTSNVLTEASNLLWCGSDPHKTEIRKVLKLIIEQSCEHLLPSMGTTICSEFMKLGLTDAGILELGSKAGIILTADLDLHLAALERGLESENFTHYSHVQNYL